LRLSGLLAAGSVALVLAAPSVAGHIVGTRGPDLLLGTSRPDGISSRGGSDRIDVAGGLRDTVSCGAGSDLVAADATDRIARDCERISRRISTDSLTGGGAQHASEAEPDSFSRGKKVVAAFQVGRYDDGGAQAIGFAVSSDAGRTWRHGLLLRLTRSTSGPFLRASDPAVAYDERHGLWLVATLALGASDSALAVNRSSDGLHWSPPLLVAQKPNGPNGIMFDKEWIACDNGGASPFHGRCYLSYSDIENLRLSNDLVLSTSRDGVAWTAPLTIPLGPGNHVIPRLAADRARPGRLALAYYTQATRGSRLDAEFVSSRDGGRTWTRPARLSPESMPVNRIARAGGAMVGDYISTSFANGRAVPVFVLAQSPRAGRLRQATYASSLVVP